MLPPVVVAEWSAPDRHLVLRRDDHLEAPPRPRQPMPTAVLSANRVDQRADAPRPRLTLDVYPP